MPVVEDNRKLLEGVLEEQMLQAGGKIGYLGTPSDLSMRVTCCSGTWYMQLVPKLHSIKQSHERVNSDLEIAQHTANVRANAGVPALAYSDAIQPPILK